MAYSFAVHPYVLPLMATISMITIVTLSLYGSLSAVAGKFCYQEGLSMDTLLIIAAYSGSNGLVVMWLKAFGFFSLVFLILSIPFIYVCIMREDSEDVASDTLKVNNGCVRVGLILFLLIFAGFIADGIYIVSNLPKDCLNGKYGESTSGVILWIVFVFSIIFVMLFGFFVSPLKSLK